MNLVNQKNHHEAVAVAVAHETVSKSDVLVAPEIHSGYEIDVLSQFRANMAQLDDLHGRLQYVLQEVSTIIRKRSGR